MLRTLLPPLLSAALLAITILTVFVWVWAMRRPPAMALPTSADPETPTESKSKELPPPFVYAAIGASDVEGIGAANPEQESWVELLYRRLPSGARLVKLGRGGITLNEANKQEVGLAVAAKPDLITLWNCVNDATRGVPLVLYTRGLKAALGRLTEETAAHIALLNLPDLSLLVPENEQERRELVRGGVQQWNDVIAGIAAQYGDRVSLVDLFPASAEALNHPEYLSADRFHLSADGYQRLAALVWEKLTHTLLLPDNA